MFKQLPPTSHYGSARRRRFSLLMLIEVSIPIVLVFIAAGVFIVPRLSSHAAGANNVNCTLIVPANPLSAQGLATPYQLVATDPANGACNEANANQAAFVQGAVIDPANGQISIYNPLVIDKGTQPAAAPVVPQLPQGGIVSLWFGFNGTNLTLQGTNNSLQQGKCVNGVEGSIFGQFAYCNAPAFFNAANAAIQAGQLVPPPLGMAKDGKTCPSVRDFSLVDQDQSDNLTTTYIVTANGQTAQATAANTAALQNTTTQTNASDNRLLAIALDNALGCTPFMAPDLANNGNMTTALPLNELQAAAQQAAPIALVPAGDPMVLNNNQPDRAKLNAYRRGVDQMPARSMAAASTKTYCNNLLNIAPARLQLDAQMTMNQASPVPAVGNNLFTFLAQRFATTFGPNGLNCMGLLNKPNPVNVTTDGNGVAISATITLPNNAGNGNGNGNNNGNGNGNGMGNGNGNNMGKNNGMGNGANMGNGTNNGTNMGTNNGANMGNGNGTNNGTNMGNGTNNGTNMGTNNGANMGNGTKNGTTMGNGNGTNNGANAGNNNGATMGTNNGTNNSANMGNNNGNGTNNGTNMGNGNDAQQQTSPTP